MARVRFTADFDYRPTQNQTVAYPSGLETTVKQACADEAVAAGKAVLVSAPAKRDDNGE